MHSTQFVPFDFNFLHNEGSKGRGSIFGQRDSIFFQPRLLHLETRAKHEIFCTQLCFFHLHRRIGSYLQQ